MLDYYLSVNINLSISKYVQIYNVSTEDCIKAIKNLNPVLNVKSSAVNPEISLIVDIYPSYNKQIKRILLAIEETLNKLVNNQINKN